MFEVVICTIRIITMTSLLITIGVVIAEEGRKTRRICVFIVVAHGSRIL
jgi:hypothetical protein